MQAEKRDLERVNLIHPVRQSGAIFTSRLMKEIKGNPRIPELVATLMSPDMSAWNGSNPFNLFYFFLWGFVLLCTSARAVKSQGVCV